MSEPPGEAPLGCCPAYPLPHTLTCPTYHPSADVLDTYLCCPTYLVAHLSYLPTSTICATYLPAVVIGPVCVNVKESEEERVEALTAEAERGWGDSLARLGELM